MSGTDIDLPANAQTKVINPWLLGADPEFAVIEPPDKTVQNSGPNEVNLADGQIGSIGFDHNYRVWELRPAPSPSAYTVVTNLWKLLMRKELGKIERFKWKSGALGGKKPTVPLWHPTPHTVEWWQNSYMAQGYTEAQALTFAQQQNAMEQQNLANYQTALANQPPPPEDTLGGHIHYGISALNPAQRAALNAVTTGLLNLDILPHKENTRRLEITSSMNPKYGHFGGGDATRECNGHIEYRCAPSWLDRPGQALASLTTYKLAGARPSSVEWPKSQNLKERYLDWLEELAQVDVDAWVLNRFIGERGFGAIQADPSSDFKPRWRRENPWDK